MNAARPKRWGEQKCHSAGCAGKNWVGNLRREERERRKKEKSEGEGSIYRRPWDPQTEGTAKMEGTMDTMGTRYVSRPLNSHFRQERL